MNADKISELLESINKMINQNGLVNAILTHYCNSVSINSDLSASEVRQQILDLAAKLEIDYADSKPPSVL